MVIGMGDAQTQGRESLFGALDLPDEAKDLQDGYWKSRREWETLDAAYHVVLADLLRSQDPAPDIRSDPEVNASGGTGAGNV